MLSDVFADPNQRLSQDLIANNFVRKYGIRMNFNAVTALLDVDPPLFNRDAFDRTELVAPNVVKVFSTAKL
jgi:hypothetical protein